MVGIPRVASIYLSAGLPLSDRHKRVEAAARRQAPGTARAFLTASFPRGGKGKRLRLFVEVSAVHHQQAANREKVLVPATLRCQRLIGNDNILLLSVSAPATDGRGRSKHRAGLPPWQQLRTGSPCRTAGALRLHRAAKISFCLAPRPWSPTSSPTRPRSIPFFGTSTKRPGSQA